jgi:acetoacetate decarboxylase
MPAGAPLYGPPPYQYADAEIVTLVYATDPNAIAGLLPNILTVGTPAIASLVVGKYPTSPFGPYLEALQMVSCQYNGTNLLYMARMFVTSDAAMAAGREIWGFPKKIGNIELDVTNGAIHALVERPAGVKICEVTAQVGASLDPKTLPPAPLAATLRMLPGPALAAAPVVVELVTLPATPFDAVWTATNWTCAFGQSTEDPWQSLPIAAQIAATYTKTGFTLGDGTVAVRLK